MGQRHPDIEFIGKMLGKVLGAVHGTMLTASAAETNLKACELPFNETLDMSIHESIYIVKELQDLHVILQELDYLGIAPGELSVILEFSGIVH